MSLGSVFSLALVIILLCQIAESFQDNDDQAIGADIPGPDTNNWRVIINRSPNPGKLQYPAPKEDYLTNSNEPRTPSKRNGDKLDENFQNKLVAVWEKLDGKIPLAVLRVVLQTPNTYYDSSF